MSEMDVDVDINAWPEIIKESKGWKRDNIDVTRPLFALDPGICMKERCSNSGAIESHRCPPRGSRETEG